MTNELSAPPTSVLDTAETFVLVDLGPRRKIEVTAKPVDPLGPQIRLEVLLGGRPTGWRLFLKPARARALAEAIVEMTDRLPLAESSLTQEPHR